MTGKKILAGLVIQQGIGFSNKLREKIEQRRNQGHNDDEDGKSKSTSHYSTLVSSLVTGLIAARMERGEESTPRYTRVTGEREDEERRPLLSGVLAGGLSESGSDSDSEPETEAEIYSPPPWRQRACETGREIWLQGKGMILVMMSQFFGASMNVMTQVLELKGRNGEGFKPFQILFARMSITVLASYLYMWYARVPHPFGTRDVLPLLVFRAAGGFWGVYGLYYSVQYLPLSEATVLTFLAPILSCYACSIFLPRETFTRKQQLAGLVSLIGVVLIARPFPFLQSGGDNGADQVHALREKPGDADQYHRVLAVIMAMVGVLGATSAYTSIRLIGQRCHPLVSVTYLSMFTTVVSALAILVVPSIPLELPGTLMEWSLLIGLGVAGFLLQFLLTAGLAYVPPPPRQRQKQEQKRSPAVPARSYGTTEHEHDRECGALKSEAEEANARPTSSGARATSMLYTQTVFALFYDSAVWGSTLSMVSWVGSALILCSALYVAMARESPPPEARAEGEEGGDDSDES